MEEKTTPYNRKAPGVEEVDVEKSRATYGKGVSIHFVFQQAFTERYKQHNRGHWIFVCACGDSPHLLKSHTICESGLPSPTQECSGEGSSCRTEPQLDHAESCNICLHELKDERIPKRYVSVGCEHELETCLKCLSRYLKSKMERTAPDEIECPSCKEHFDFFAIKEFADPVTFEKYTLPQSRISYVQPPLIPTLDTIACYLTNI